MSIPSWWPYRYPPKQVAKTAGAILVGVFIGARVVNDYFKPLEGYEEELARGKAELLLKYKQRYETQRAEFEQKLANESKGSTTGHVPLTSGSVGKV
jgi:hypothetical protein